MSAKITAWYAGRPANSGYRVLKSSGRLESDLLDALNEKLNPNAVQSSSASSSRAGQPVFLIVPSANASFFNTPRLTTAPSTAALTRRPSKSRSATTKRTADTHAAGANLEQALHDQTTSDNLAVVKRSNTPVVAQPLEGRKCYSKPTPKTSSRYWMRLKAGSTSRSPAFREAG